MASFKILLRSDRPNGRGECPLYLRITHDRKKKYHKLDLRIKPKYWNPDRQNVRKSHDNSKSINLEIDRVLQGAQQAFLHLSQSGQPVTAQAIKQEVQGVNMRSFYTYFDSVIETFGYWQKKHYEVLKRKLERFHDGELLFSEITAPFLRSFRHYLKTEVGNGQNTRSKELGRVRRILNQAVKDRIIKHQQNPFATGQIELTWEKPESTVLTPEEFAEFSKPHFPDDHPYTLYQKTFMFCVYADGMRIGDCLALPGDAVQDGILQYSMMKTGKTKTIQLPERALQIIEWLPEPGKWLFPYLSDKKKYDENTIREDIKKVTSRINKGLGEVAKKAELDKNVSTHVARHTFSYLADENGWSITEIQEALQHSNIRETRDYIGRLRSDRLTEKRNELFD